MTEKDRIFRHAEKLKQERKQTHRSYTASKAKLRPDLEEKFKEFCRDEQEFLKNFYSPDYNMTQYVQKILDGKNE